MKTTAALILAATLVGCASPAPPQYVKQGGAVDDRVICEAQARAAGAPISNGFFAADAMRETFRACMLARGYQQVTR
jgi:hypothetical protein